MQSKDMLIAALNADPTATPTEKKRVIAAIENKQSRTEKYLTTKEACALLGDIHPITLRRLEQRQVLIPVRYSKRKLRWRESQLRDFLDHGIVNDTDTHTYNDSNQLQSNTPRKESIDEK